MNNKGCETCKYSELSGDCYPCHCCAVVYSDPKYTIMWEPRGCELCEGATKFSSIFLNHGELIGEDDDGNEVVMLEVNYCPMCGKKLVKE